MNTLNTTDTKIPRQSAPRNDKVGGRVSRRGFLKLGLAAMAAMAMPAGIAAAAEPEPAPRRWDEPAGPLFSGMPRTPGVALTFDDGFVNVRRLLDVCKAAGVTVTLFPIATQIEKNPELWQRARAEGHAIGCHTYSHEPLGGQPYEVVAGELARFMDVARTNLGDVPVRYFRPPFGSGWNDAALKRAAAAQGMRVVMWNRVNTMNERAAQPTWREVAAGFEAQARAGDIFLYHFRWQEVEALPAIVELCARWGWRVGGLEAVA